MKLTTRVLVAGIALFMLTNGLGFWFAYDQISPLYQLALDNPLARAGVRADIGGFFLVVAALTSYAAAKRNPQAALIAAGMFLVAVTGRLISVVFDGAAPQGTLPMLVEATSATILLWSSHVWSTEESETQPGHFVTKLS